MRLVREAVGLLGVTLDAGADDVLPGGLAAVVARDHVVEIELLARQHPGAVLARALVPLKDVVARELQLLARQPVEKRQQDDARQPDRAALGGDGAGDALADPPVGVGAEAEAAAANAENKLDQVQDELFAFSKSLIENPELRAALTNNGDTLVRKVELVKNIFGSKFGTSTIKLVNQIVSGRSGRSIEKVLSAHIHAVTARRNRVNAFVKSSIALTSTQQEKLASSLTKKIGQSVHLNIDIDKTVIGGISVRFGDEVIDGTIKNRLAEASRTLVS